MVEMKPPKGRHIKALRKKLLAIGRAESDEEQARLADELFDYIDEVTAELAGITVEELDEMDEDEKAKLTRIITDKVEDSMSFVRSSPRQ